MKPTATRHIFRRFVQALARGLLRVATRSRVEGLHNIPSQGAALIVFNHLAHLDPVLLIAFSPRLPEGIALSDLMSVPVTGAVLRAYGAIPVHRDRYDRQVIRAALSVLEQGRLLALAPEARQSPSGQLEKGREGAAYLALKSGAPLVPVGLTGTQHAYNAWGKRARPEITMVVGTPFHLPENPGATRREALEVAHRSIMTHIAQLLPPEYRGYWAEPST
ncbi:MAG: 1-acyl-sn-glycerol-3-phosphate acyltransferase [Thermoflexales bacterium]|nr:1-acyl-sn-glycerol-3-phosphate acyltransferase [Thermoflexales bacterium]